MKKLILFILLFTFSFSTAQKKELRNANKDFIKGEYASAIDKLDSAKDLFDSSNDKLKAQVMLLYGKIYTTTEDFGRAIKSFDMSKNLGLDGQILNKELSTLQLAIETSAIGDEERENWSEGAVKLKMIYDLDPNKNQQYLYYAAGFSVSAKDFSSALEYYELLRDINYKGITTNFYVTEVATGVEIMVNENQFNTYLLTKDYEKPRQEETDSKFPEIVKQIALIYKEFGQNDKALASIQIARSANPDDVNLILSAASIYYELENYEMFDSLTKEAIEKDPNNATLYFNLGVVNQRLQKLEDSTIYYERSIELDPSYINSYFNLVQLKLDSASKVRAEMDSLGQSRADNLKYDELKIALDDYYQQSVPILRDLIEVSNDQAAIRQLQIIYSQLGNNEGFMEMKNLLEQQD